VVGVRRKRSTAKRERKPVRLQNNTPLREGGDEETGGKGVKKKDCYEPGLKNVTDWFTN